MTTYRNESDVPMVGGDVPGAPHAGDTTRWLYDEPSGCVTNKVYADGKGPSYTYTPDGKLSRRIWARGIITDYTYDSAGQLVSTTYSDAPSEATTMPAFGLRVTSTSSAVSSKPSTVAGVDTKLDDLLLDELNIKAVEYIADETALCDVSFKANFKTLGRKCGPKMKAVAASIAAMTSFNYILHPFF